MGQPASVHFRRAASKLLGAGAIFIVLIPLVPLVVPGFEPPAGMMELSFGAGIVCVLVAFGILWYDRTVSS